MNQRTTTALLPAVLLLAASAPLQAWDYEGHRVVNQLALAALPAKFPGFVRTPEASERIAFLGGEADRWRNVRDLPLSHCNGPDHYLDLEQLADYQLTPEALPVMRGDFVASLARFRAAHPDRLKAIDPAFNSDHTRELVGLLPWAVAENFGKAKSGFACLRAFEENGGTPAEIGNTQQNILYVMGVMGHFVGDAGQPLHTTIHHHGWEGANPLGYTTNRSFHAWIDGGWFGRHGLPDAAKLRERLRPADLVLVEGKPARGEELVGVLLRFLAEQNKQVAPLYQLDKDGKLAAEGAPSAEARAFLEGQLVKSGQLLADIWFTAWQQAPRDKFLIDRLNERAGTKPAPRTP